ncbi:thioredoxin family protein [Desulfurobacterium thermolithotrophum]|uniref:thioredoxin family protein n=1 Tax=Desulfurobacterium thermolithotrophum TaxID=64160 RepID=UPI0013D62225|nr:thioredoxin family protein [Desulfurobacterium thermolithotrophum]
MGIKLILFSSERCSVCHALKIKVEELAKEFKAQFEEISIDKNPEVAANRLILSAPVVILEIDDKEVNRWAGIFSISEIENFLKRVL